MTARTFTPTVHFSFAPEASTFIGDVRTRLSRLAQLPEKPVDLVDLIQRFPRGPIEGRLKRNPAGRANETRLVLDAGGRPLELLAALGAAERQCGLVHVSSPSSVLGTPTIERPGRARP